MVSEANIWRAGRRQPSEDVRAMTVKLDRLLPDTTDIVSVRCRPALLRSHSLRHSLTAPARVAYQKPLLAQRGDDRRLSPFSPKKDAVLDRTATRGGRMSLKEYEGFWSRDPCWRSGLANFTLTEHKCGYQSRIRPVKESLPGRSPPPGQVRPPPLRRP